VVRAFYRLCSGRIANLHALATRRASSPGRHPREKAAYSLSRLKEGSTVAEFSWAPITYTPCAGLRAAKEPPMPELDVQVPAEHEKAVSPSQHKATQVPQASERRRERRQRGPRQVWIQGTDVHGKPIEEIQIMQDYSRGGFYFVSSLHCYYVGMRLHVIPSFGSLNLEFVAEVVRVEPKPQMAYGVGVKLLHARDPIAPYKPTQA
jgi:hypothetical protein